MVIQSPKLFMFKDGAKITVKGLRINLNGCLMCFIPEQEKAVFSASVNGGGKSNLKPSQVYINVGNGYVYFDIIMYIQVKSMSRVGQGHPSKEHVKGLSLVHPHSPTCPYPHI